MESEELKRVWTQWKALQTLVCAVPCSISVTALYIHVYLDATGCMVWLYMFKYWQYHGDVLTDHCFLLANSEFLCCCFDRYGREDLDVLGLQFRKDLFLVHTHPYYILLIVPSLWVSLFLSKRGWMLNNECHSVLTYQPIWFYSHVSAAVEKNRYCI